jgi:hypothetical protein
VAAIAAVGVARSAYEYVLKWAKTYTAGSDKPIIHYQAVGYALADVAMKIEACRAFSWKAAHYLDLHDSEGHAVGAMAKVFCGEVLFGAVFKAMQVMGVNSLDRRHPVERFLREALVFPLYDAGNIGMQMRKIGASWRIWSTTQERLQTQSRSNSRNRWKAGPPSQRLNPCGDLRVGALRDTGITMLVYPSVWHNGNAYIWHLASLVVSLR